jgi:2-keto-4-pentenoate hydratase/2-oxohepta-3-ene-1,7-dioic acid hydratase in catechol pathway
VSSVGFGIANVKIGGVIRPAVLGPSGVLPLGDLLKEVPATTDDMLDDWDVWIDRIEAALADHRSAAWIAEDDVQFAPAGHSRPAIYGAGANYRSHLKEMSGREPARSYHFLLSPTSLNAHRGAIRRPPGFEQLDWEVELAVVIGRSAYRAERQDALSYVAGYTIANDVSGRGERMRHPIFGLDWVWSKNADGFTPLGPAIVPARFVKDPHRLDLSLKVNGVVRQQASTSDLISDVADQIASIAATVTLRPGDVILTGTPAGTGKAWGTYLQDGDRLEATVEGLGKLENVVEKMTASQVAPGTEQ